MILILISALIFLYLFNHFYWKRKHLPPGPLPLPVIGNVLSFINAEPPEALINWRKEYGDIYTYWLGELPIVSVNDFNTIMTKFVKEGDNYAGRPYENLENLELNKNGRTGIIFTDGDLWRDLRRFSLHTLRDFGVGRNLMQEKILDEVVVMLNSIKQDMDNHSNNNNNIQKHIDISVGSIIMQLIFGYKYSSTEETKNEFYRYKGLIDSTVKEFGSFAGLLFQKYTHRYKHLPYVGRKYKKLMNIKKELFKMIDENIETIRNRIDFESNSEPGDYVEAFLKKQYELKKKGETNEAFTNEQLSGALWDLYIAGQETTTNTLGWACIYLVNNEHVQQKIHQELDEIIGSDRLITNDDKPNLHYLNAVITEVQRLCNLVPNNVIHRVTKDVEIHGYKIPKDTIITDQISVVLYDEDIFPNPMKFKPERHLDENNNFKPHPAVIPFGVGKRSCLGESLARMELFLFLANICNFFKLTSDYPIKEKRSLGGTVQPPVFTLNVDNRF